MSREISTEKLKTNGERPDFRKMDQKRDIIPLKARGIENDSEKVIHEVIIDAMRKAVIDR